MVRRILGESVESRRHRRAGGARLLLQYSLHAPRRGREDVRAFITEFRKAFPDLGFSGVGELIAEGDYVVGRWQGGGTKVTVPTRTGESSDAG